MSNLPFNILMATSVGGSFAAIVYLACLTTLNSPAKVVKQTVNEDQI